MNQTDAVCKRPGCGAPFRWLTGHPMFCKTHLVEWYAALKHERKHCWEFWLPKECHCWACFTRRIPSGETTAYGASAQAAA